MVPVDSRRLHYFLAVYEQGSLGRAAAALNLTQPALSKSISQLEAELKVKLFDRTPKGLAPTVYGETLALHARIVRSELRHAEQEIALMTGAAKGEVRIGVTPSIAIGLMPRVGAALHEERPGIQLTVVEALMQDHAPALRRGELDLILGGWSRGMDSDFATEVVGSDTVCVCACAGHPLVGGRVRLAALLDYPWVMPPHTEFWLDHLDRTFTSAGLHPPTGAVLSNSASFITSMVRGGDYLSYLPSLLTERHRAAGEIVLLEAPELKVSIDVNVTFMARSALSATVSATVDKIRAVCADPSLRT